MMGPAMTILARAVDLDTRGQGSAASRSCEYLADEIRRVVECSHLLLVRVLSEGDGRRS